MLPLSATAVRMSAFDEDYVTGEGLSSESDEFGCQEALIESDFDPEEEANLDSSDEEATILSPPSKKVKRAKERKRKNPTGKRKSKSKPKELENPVWAGKAVPRPVNFNPRECGPTRHARSLAQSKDWSSPRKWLNFFIKDHHWHKWTSETNAFAECKEGEHRSTRGWSPGTDIIC